MEGKTVILSVLIMFLIMAQIQVEARDYRVCCRDRRARDNFNKCRRRPGLSDSACAVTSGCILERRSGCPRAWPIGTLENSGGDDVNEYCNLGCESSVCGALTNLKNSDASEIAVNEALEKCTKACSTLCATGSNTALDQITLDDQIALDQSA